MGGAITLGNPSSATDSGSRRHHSHSAFLLCNYVLLGAASSCIFLTLSLRLVPSGYGFLLVLLHALTIAGAVFGCSAAAAIAAAAKGGRWHGAHMAATVLAAILQGSVAVLVFTRTEDFLGELRSYVREDDAAVILKMAGGLGVVIFCLEWVVLTLAFVLRYDGYVDRAAAGGLSAGAMRSSKVLQDDEMRDWPWPFQV